MGKALTQIWMEGVYYMDMDELEVNGIFSINNDGALRVCLTLNGDKFSWSITTLGQTHQTQGLSRILEISLTFLGSGLCKEAFQ